MNSNRYESSLSSPTKSWSGPGIPPRHGIEPYRSGDNRRWINETRVGGEFWKSYGTSGKHGIDSTHDGDRLSIHFQKRRVSNENAINNTSSSR
jgi:hypothetical protein